MYDVKSVTQQTLCHDWKTIIDFKWQKQVSLSSFRPPKDRVCKYSFANFSVKSLKRDQSYPPFFSLVNTFNINLLILGRMACRCTLHKPPSFPPNNLCWEGGWCLPNGLGGRLALLRSTLADFFHQIKMRQQIGRKGFYPSHLTWMRIWEGFLYKEEN